MKSVTVTARRWLRRGVIGPCLALMIGSGPASGAEVAEVAMPPALVASMRCSTLRYVLVEDFYSQLNVPRRGLEGRYSAQQTRVMLDRLDHIITPFCKIATDVYARQTGTGPGMLTAQLFAKDMPGDEKAMAWLRLNSLFLTEIEPIHLYAQLGSKLYPDTSNETMPPMTPALDAVVKTAASSTFNDEQRDSRIMLIMFAAKPRFAAILPSRFDVAGLAVIEQKLRAAGAPVFKRYMLDLHMEHLDVKTTRELTPAEKQELAAAEKAAKESISVLAAKFALPYADRYK